MNALSDLHVLLFVFDRSEGVRELGDHLLELVLIDGDVRARLDIVHLGDIHGEHDDLGRHGRHLIAEAVLVDAVGVRRERVLAVGLAIALIDQLVVGPGDLDVDVEEAALDHFEHETELGASLGPVEVAVLRVGVYGDKVLLAEAC